MRSSDCTEVRAISSNFIASTPVLAALIIWPSVSLFLPRLIVPDMLK
jgi:hypothetical protein